MWNRTDRGEAMKRRYGSFLIPRQLIETDEANITRVMGACIILRAEMRYATDGILYEAYSFRFRELAEGEIMPLYDWVFTDEGDMQAVERGY